MGFHQLTLKWAECDFCTFKTRKDPTTKDIYLKQYLEHLRIKHSDEARNVITDLSLLLSGDTGNNMPAWF